MTGEELPQARVRGRRLFQLVWVVPLIAIGLAAWLVWQHLRVQGPEITIRFEEGAGLRPGQTPVLYRGVQVGEVRGIALTPDGQYVVVRARLVQSAENLVREGAQFWVVRPQLGWGNVTGLNTVLSGPEIHMTPGKGEPRTDFTGRDAAPLEIQAAEGLRFVLRAPRTRAVRGGTPIYYRGVEVGRVLRVDLTGNSAQAEIQAVVFERYAGLVRDGSAFWSVSGATLTANLREGVRFQLDSLRDVVAGGIEFATPSEKAPRAKPGAVFFLYEEPRQEWLAWQPKVPVPRQK